MEPGVLKVGTRAGKYELTLIRRDQISNNMVQVWQDDAYCVEWSGSIPSELDLDMKRGLFGNV